MNSLLEERIKEYKIPDWPYSAAFDRVTVFILPEAKATRETFVPGGKILMTDERKAATKLESPRAVVVSAGLSARDYLASHGMGLGHIVWIARLSPWRHQVEKDEAGKDIEFFFLRAGDLCGSEDTKRWEAEGRVRVTVDAEGKHHYVFDDDIRPRFDPPSYVA